MDFDRHAYYNHDGAQRRSWTHPTPAARLVERGQVRPTPVPAALLRARCDRDECENAITTTVWSTYYVDEQGQSTTCTTTQFDATTITSYAQPTPTVPVHTIFQTMTSTLSNPPQQPIVTSPPFQIVQVTGEHCACERSWLKSLLGGIPNGTGDVIAAVVFFLPFLLYFLVTVARLIRYAFNREIFFALLPLVIFLATMVAFLPTRAYAAVHHDTGHVLAQHVLFAVAAPILVDVALQVYALLRKRAEPSGWIDATSVFMRLVNLTVLILYGVAAGQLVSFVNGWQSATTTCASGTPSQISSLTITADFLELFALVMGLVCLFLARWRLRIPWAVLLIQAHIYFFLFVFFIWRTAHDVSAARAWSGRQDRSCAPMGSPGNAHDTSNSFIVYSFHMDWKGDVDLSQTGMNDQAAFWLLAVLPIFLAATMLMAVNLVVYTEATPEIQPMADSTRYKLCYNEDEKKMEFVRIDNPGGPRLPTGEPLYEVVRDDAGEGWEIREARVPTVLPAWDNITMRPWYK